MLKAEFFTKSVFFSIILCLIVVSTQAQTDTTIKEKEISHSFYFTANTGLENSKSQVIFNQIVAASQEDENASLLVLGNITEEGYPKNKDERATVEQKLNDDLLQPLKNFNGQVIFNPGTNEWREGGGQENLDDMESFLQDNAEVEFWPNDGCPLEKEEINDDVVLLMVDSQWFLENWDKHPYINNKCEIKSREQFFAAFKDDIKDSHGKTIIVAVHHPVMSNSRIGFLDKIGGLSPQSYNNEQQRFLRGRLKTLARQYNDVIFVSGNDRNLQYLLDDETPQIISGAAAGTNPAVARDEKNFISEKNGYAKLTVYDDQSSMVEFFEVTQDGPQLLFSKDIKREWTRMDKVSYNEKSDFGRTKTSSIYTSEETDKGGIYTWLWGERYRDVYSTNIEAPVLFLDTLPGNLKPFKEGGGMQSRSLRFIDDNEHEYTLRALRKSALRWLQSTTIKDQYIINVVDSTVAQRYAMDLFTTAHPYARYSLGHISDVLDISTAHPEIYYVPKQKALGTHNDEYGDELYMFQAHVGDENKEFEKFGSPDDILSTTDLFIELRENPDAYVDETTYIRARLLDMLIGDWDRHYDQWRWGEYEQENGKKMYKPIPRDRDFAFPKYDGPLVSLIKTVLPLVRKMESYDENVDNVKWFNLAGYPLDNKLIRNSRWEDWEEQVNFIQDNLTNAEVEEAFENLPEAARDTTIEDIKSSLKARRENLQDIARRYYSYLNEFEILPGTDEDDEFLISRKDNGETEISISTEGSEYFRHSYFAEETDDIWIYGLDGNDTFRIEGKGDDLIKLKILGGEENDIYDFENTKRAKLYDYKSRKNTIKNPRSRKWLVDSYDINNYDSEKRKYSNNRILPNAGYNGDEGVKIGLVDIFTTYGLANNPFKARHRFGVDYYFATSGFSFDYAGEFAHIFYNWNFRIEGRYTSPNFTMNYFGAGNETEYDRSEVERDFNRTRIQQREIAPSLVWRGNSGGSFYFKTMVQSMEVSHDDHRYIGQIFSEENDVFDEQFYAGAEVNYKYLNQDNPAYPMRGMRIGLTSGYKSNIDDHNNRFGYLRPSFSIDYPLHPSGIAVLATKVAGDIIFGDNYEYYHAARIGGNESLRAYRNERFYGKSAFYQSTDLRVGLSRFRTNFVPIQMGVSAGFDYGRVWTEFEDSNRWHSNYGGSLWVTAFYALTGNLGFYHGEDGNRVTFTVGFKF
ncbi:metallophosphatase [Autumnicola musiva]|uniref:Metallophosphatase n=1 Tax=Autumnicola musiva TaxID=3075589 RepID=A0ABU3D5B1_9FLAO|nr:metallophosphatase [Zunongwangia sp. F117]MDT0676564.1 metallophosphatase [Zunongwangia sp. F117]